MRGWVAKRMPTRESLLRQRWLRPFAHRLTHPSLWHFNRAGVARGIALGLFCGFMIPLGQTPVAALLALTARANLIVAAVATLVTNPITFPAIYYGAYQVGDRLLSDSWAMSLATADNVVLRGLAWFLSVSAPIALGLLIFGTVAGAAGYLGVNLGWRVWVRRRWVRRSARRTASGPSPSI